MGRLREELTDPWGPLVAGVLGGMAAVLPGAGLAVGVGVAAAVYGVKVATGALLGRERAGPALERPARGTPAAHWLGRAEKAVQALHELAEGNSPTDEAARRAAGEAGGVLDAMRRLAAQTVAVSQALARSEGPRLDHEAAQLRLRAEQYPDDASAQRSADAVADRVAVRDRLRRAQSTLEGRLQSSALGLEGLVARVAELRATAAAVGQIDPSADDLAALTTEVEGLRLGLSEVEALAQRALGQD